ncbi:MBL fold metallo-hydrolase [Leptobacterium flavescens]|nr:MBL fold metallo-hydrolase [Leptobacterium flavescens]
MKKLTALFTMVLLVTISSCKDRATNETNQDDKKTEKTESAEKSGKDAQESLGFDPAQPMMTELKNGVYQYFQFFTNSLVVVTDEGVLVVDPVNEKRAADMRAEVRKITDKPVVKVVYTHDHFDHARGGQIFKEEGAEFITHQLCSDLLNRDLEKRVVLPDVMYEGDYHRIELGGKYIDLHYLGPNESFCMSVVHMPQDGGLLLGADWHLPGTMLDYHRQYARNMLGQLNTFKAVYDKGLEFDTVISSHSPKSSPEAFEEDYRFHQALFDAVWAGLQEGKSVEELRNTIELPEFKHWRGYENLPDNVDRMAYSIWHGN